MFDSKAIFLRFKHFSASYKNPLILFLHPFSPRSKIDNPTISTEK
jgi:hypothetical protein